MSGRQEGEARRQGKKARQEGEARWQGKKARKRRRGKKEKASQEGEPRRRAKKASQTRRKDKVILHQLSILIESFDQSFHSGKDLNPSKWVLYTKLV